MAQTREEEPLLGPTENTNIGGGQNTISRTSNSGEENPVIDPTDPNIVDPLPDGDRTFPDVELIGPAPPVLPGVPDTPPPSVGPGGQADPLLGPKYVQTPGTETGFDATTREVQDNELVSNQLTGLLAGDSKYMRQARQEGLELGGGLGGTQGIRSAYSSAIKAGMPIAIADAQAFRDAAAQNMDALNSFGLANIQRQTQLELGTMDANTRLQTTAMNNAAQMSIAKMQDITARDLGNLSAATQLAVTELNGDIQARLANQAFNYDRILNDELNQDRLEQIDRSGAIDLEKQEALIAANREANYLQNYLTTYDQYLSRLDALNGIEMDDAARARAQQAITEGFEGEAALMAALYPEVEPIRFG